MIPIECRYCNPLAVSASFSMSGCGLRYNGDQAYEAKAVHLRVLRCEVNDVSVSHPFADYA